MLPPLIEKLLRNALHVKDGETEMVVFRCSLHGASENAAAAKVADCEECWAIAFFLQHILSGDNGEANTHRLGRAMANACQSQREGSFDFIPVTAASHLFDDAAADHLRGSIQLTDN